LILRAAREQFGKFGYDQVSMSDLAAAVEITPGGLYRHFRNKHDLLVNVVFEGIDDIEAAIRTPDTGNPAGNLDAMLERLTVCTLDRREYPVLWQRESRNLSDEQRNELRARFRGVGREAEAVLGPARPARSPAELDFLVWAIIAVQSSVSHHSATLPRVRLAHLLRQMSFVVADFVPASDDGLQSIASRPYDRSTDERLAHLSLPRASRREMILGAAISLFAERGYPATSMDDVGGLLGISGPAVYEYFSSKADVLVAAVTRGVERLEASLSEAMQSADTPRGALAAVVESYVAHILQQTDLVSTLITEVVHVPEPQRQVIVRIQQHYVAEWVQILRLLRPDLSPSEARIVTHAVLSLFNDLARMRRFRSRKFLGEDLIRLGMDLFRGRPAGT
jgi:AcrR family transcriptional regulator